MPVDAVRRKLMGSEKAGSERQLSWCRRRRWWCRSRKGSKAAGGQGLFRWEKRWQRWSSERWCWPVRCLRIDGGELSQLLLSIAPLRCSRWLRARPSRRRHAKRGRAQRTGSGVTTIRASLCWTKRGAAHEPLRDIDARAPEQQQADGYYACCCCCGAGAVCTIVRCMYSSTWPRPASPRGPAAAMAISRAFNAVGHDISRQRV